MSREFTHTDESALPVWLGEREKINEPLFCEELLKEKQLRYINGSFFSTMGAVDENELSAQIYKTISPYVTSNLITSRIPVEVEAKGVQSMQADLYSRFICFGNGSPKALYDKSDGFTRRLIILTTNPVPKDRVPDPNITDKFIAEKDLIFLWMFEGLKRLIANNFRFTISERTKRNLSDMAAENCNIAEFLADSEYVAFGVDYEVSSNQLYGGYSNWCSVNGLTQLKQDTFTSWLKSNLTKYNIAYSTNIKSGNNHVRGFKGIRTSYTPFVA